MSGVFADDDDSSEEDAKNPCETNVAFIEVQGFKPLRGMPFGSMGSPTSKRPNRRWTMGTACVLFSY